VTSRPDNDMDVYFGNSTCEIVFYFDTFSTCHKYSHVTRLLGFLGYMNACNHMTSAVLGKKTHGPKVHVNFLRISLDSKNSDKGIKNMVFLGKKLE